MGTWTCSRYLRSPVYHGWESYVCALGVQEGGVINASSSVSGREVSGGGISWFMVANGYSNQCLVQ